MIDGAYDIIMKTPVGPKSGVLCIVTKSGTLRGFLEILGSVNAFTEGKVVENRCSFSGEIKTALEKVAYEAECVFENNRLTALVKTVKGSMPITGTKQTM